MGEYISYYAFFSEGLKIIKDVKLDFDAEGLSGEEFDKSFKTFLNKFLNRCKTFLGATFRGKSKIISNYISEIRNVETLTTSQRFDQMVMITEKYTRMVV